jgi:hypothetical protein
MQMTKEIMTQFLESEQVGNIFVIRRSITNHFSKNEILKPINPTRPKSSIGGSI